MTNVPKPPNPVECEGECGLSFDPFALHDGYCEDCCEHCEGCSFGFPPRDIIDGYCVDCYDVFVLGEPADDEVSTAGK